MSVAHPEPREIGLDPPEQPVCRRDVALPFRPSPVLERQLGAAGPAPLLCGIEFDERGNVRRCHPWLSRPIDRGLGSRSAKRGKAQGYYPNAGKQAVRKQRHDPKERRVATASPARV